MQYTTYFVVLSRDKFSSFLTNIIIIKERNALCRVVERWIEEMILTLVGQSQRLSHMCIWKFSGVFSRIRITLHKTFLSLIIPFRATRAQQIDQLTSEWLRTSVRESNALASQRSWVRIPLIEDTWNFSGANNYETIAEIVLHFIIVIFIKFWCNHYNNRK